MGKRTITIELPEDVDVLEDAQVVKSVLVNALNAFIVAREDASAYVAERYAGNSELDSQAKIAEVEGRVSLARRLLRGVHTNVAKRDEDRAGLALEICEALADLKGLSASKYAATARALLSGWSFLHNRKG